MIEKGRHISCVFVRIVYGVVLRKSTLKRLELGRQGTIQADCGGTFGFAVIVLVLAVLCEINKGKGG